MTISIAAFGAKCSKTLKSIGLIQSIHSPCIFHGSLIPGKSPRYLGLYVNNLIYFSASNTVKQNFEASFQEKVKVAFNGPVSQFLGIKFTNIKHSNGNLSIYMNQTAYIDYLPK